MLGFMVSKHFPGRTLSVPRLALLMLVAAAVVMAALTGWSRVEDGWKAAAGQGFFAGYVDATATPMYAFENPRSAQGESVMLSFVVADPQDPCAPSWGAAYSLDEARSSLDLDRRIARLVQSGGEVSVSFGGLLNDELATVCTNIDKLTGAYREVVERYSLGAIDLDIEAGNLTDRDAGVRRAKAIAALQQERAAADKPLAVWLTLPVAPSGLTEQGTDDVARMLAAGVDLAGVNVMTMDYGQSRSKSMTMADAAIAAAESTHRQLTVLYSRAGIDLGPQALWRKIGVTPMIGQNDVPGEVFDLDAAVAINTFVLDKGVGRVSMWSLNRDVSCGSNYADTAIVSDSCSGVEQHGVRFADALGAGLSGRATMLRDAPAPTETPRSVAIDDPATSPYPIWEEQATYAAQDRVVWHRSVYVAKYWTQGDLPDNPVLQATETPWVLLGPVLPGETPEPRVTVLPGTFPDWDPEIVYVKGDRILLEGEVFEAKWWNRAESPEATQRNSDASPWRAIDAAEVEKAD